MKKFTALLLSALLLLSPVSASVYAAPTAPLPAAGDAVSVACS